MNATEWAAWVQAVATIVLAGLTWQYVRKTQQLVESSVAPPWLEADIIDDDPLPSIVVSDSGPGDAVYITVRISVYSEELPNGWYACLSGPVALKSGGVSKYSFTRIHSPIHVPCCVYVLLDYRNAAGKKFGQSWEFTQPTADRYKRLLEPTEQVPNPPYPDLKYDWLPNIDKQWTVSTGVSRTVEK